MTLVEILTLLTTWFSYKTSNHLPTVYLLCSIYVPLLLCVLNSASLSEHSCLVLPLKYFSFCLPLSLYPIVIRASHLPSDFCLILPSPLPLLFCPAFCPIPIHPLFMYYIISYYIISQYLLKNRKLNCCEDN